VRQFAALARLVDLLTIVVKPREAARRQRGAPTLAAIEQRTVWTMKRLGSGARGVGFSLPVTIMLMAMATTSALQACGDDDVDHDDHGPGAGDSVSRSGASEDGSKPAGESKPAAPIAGAGADKGSQSVELRFAPKVGSAKFACGEVYPNVGTPGREIRPVDFRFYVHDVRLVTDAGDEAPVELAQDKTWQYENVALIDFEDGSGECNQGDDATHTKLTGTVAAGRYTGIKFKLGIPQALNHSDLSAQPSPLNKSSLFWGWNYGHVYFAATSRAEALVDEDAGVEGDTGDASTDEDAGAGLQSINDHFTHIGATGCEGNPAAGMPIAKCTHANRPEYTLMGFDPGKSAVVVDFAEVKRDSDLAATSGCHSFTADTCTSPFDHLGIDFATGSSTPTTQTVFRVE
jgi:uncharacterized repeat protein (TIGR04052 family)